MIKLKFKIKGVVKEFEKDEFTITDNLLAVEHQIMQADYFKSEEDRLNIKKHRALQENYLKMFSEIFDNTFTPEELGQANKNVLNDLAEIYSAALGGEEKEESKKEGNKGKK